VFVLAKGTITLVFIASDLRAVSFSPVHGYQKFEIVRLRKSKNWLIRYNTE